MFICDNQVVWEIATIVIAVFGAGQCGEGRDGSVTEMLNYYKPCRILESEYSITTLLDFYHHPFISISLHYC